MTDFYAGETIVWVAGWLDRKRRPVMPQPTLGVSVEVKNAAEDATHLAESAMLLQAEHTGTATSGALGTLTEEGQQWDEDAYAGAVVQITSGMGAGQERRIKSNSGDTLTLEEDSQFDVAPDATSVYRIHRSRWELAWNSTVDLADTTVVAVIRAKDDTYTSIEKVALPLKGRKVV